MAVEAGDRGEAAQIAQRLRRAAKQLGELLTPEMAGSALVDLVRADRASTAPGYLLTGVGLQKPP
jgi:hypothetical protein